MKLKLLLASTSILLITACTSAPKPPPPVVNQGTFENQISHSFDNTLKRSVLKGPTIFNHTTRVHYSLIVDDDKVKLKYNHRYRAQKAKNIFQVVDSSGVIHNVSNVRKDVGNCRTPAFVWKRINCVIQESGVVNVESALDYKLIALDDSIIDLSINKDYLNAINSKKSKMMKIGEAKRFHKNAVGKHKRSKLDQKKTCNKKRKKAATDLAPSVKTAHNTESARKVETVTKQSVKMIEVDTVTYTKSQSIKSQPKAKRERKIEKTTVVNAKDLKDLGYIK